MQGGNEVENENHPSAFQLIEDLVDVRDGKLPEPETCIPFLGSFGVTTWEMESWPKLQTVPRFLIEWV